MEIPLNQLKTLLETLEEGGVTEFEYEDEKVRLRLALGRSLAGTALQLAAAPQPVVTPPVAPPGQPLAAVEDAAIAFITSPFVGTFYRASAPDASPFVEVGSVIKTGQTLCIVEAMKLMNEIEAEFAGTIIEVLVENGQSVEFGQKLFKLRRS